jgi:hypothetical protein
MIGDLKNEFKANFSSQSEIWNEEFIANLLKNKKTTFEINKERSQYLIPSTDLITPNNSQIPILLIQNSLNNTHRSIHNGNLMTGWDLIVPASWSMPFWLTLIHCGARAIGQNEMKYLYFESGNQFFPYEGFSDCAVASECVEVERTNEIYKKYSKRPASKRGNFFKLHFLTPFSSPWRSLLKLNQNSNEPHFILRERKILLQLQASLLDKRQRIVLTNDELMLTKGSYVGVRLIAVEKGSIRDFSLLYSSNKSSLNKKLKDQILNRILNKRRSSEIAKIKSECSNQNLSPSLTLRRLLKYKFDKTKLLLEGSDESLFFEFEMEMKRNDNEHQLPIGFVTTSSFSLVNGMSCANGFILTSNLIDIINNKNSIINYKIPINNTLKQCKITSINI